MSRNLRKNYDVIKAYASLPVKAKREVLRCANTSLVNGICEVIYNTLIGRVPLSIKQKNRFKKYKNTLRLLGFKKQIPLKRKRKLLIQSGGFLSSLLPLAASILVPLIFK